VCVCVCVCVCACVEGCSCVGKSGSFKVPPFLKLRKKNAKHFSLLMLSS